YDAELDRIDDEVRKVRIPWAYAEELYQLRLHIRYVRDELHGRARPRTSDRP
ncbi:MAG: C4-dicarboxylate ABC transporter substrate-binding protein, partial [Gammaproteobacteria bacterium]|nr:C4-dicarboxylate ABC transporter substrate-binding protein [Gammaproteobacteria bacterium]